jgi:hypothetical protein
MASQLVRNSRLSIHAAPYQVNFKSGVYHTYTRLQEIAKLRQNRIASVFDRHAKSFLDLDTLWKQRRRKFIAGPASEDK